MSRPFCRPLLLLAAALALASSGRASADDGTTAEQTIRAMNKLWGEHAGIRANHAKGVVLEGVFKPSKDAAGLSKAKFFALAEVPVTVRFSNSTGVPDLPDNDPNANPRGMSVKFRPPGGEEIDIVANSLKFFPVKNGEEFRDLLQAVIASGPGAAKPSPIEQFFAAHPRALEAFKSVSTPASFATEVYNGVDAFVFVDAAGKRQPFRYRISPEGGPSYLDEAAAKAKPAGWLAEDIRARAAKGPVVFRLEAQLAEAGDPVEDPSQPWPASRRFVDLGTLSLTRVVADLAAADKELSFIPQNLTDGIEPSADPLIDARNEAYAISVSKRSQ